MVKKKKKTYITPDSSKNCSSTEQYQVSILVMEVWLIFVMSLPYCSMLDTASGEAQSGPGHGEHGAGSGRQDAATLGGLLSTLFLSQIQNITP